MNYKLFVFLFALFVTCTPNFLLKKKFILQEIAYSALFSIILYFTYDILKINKETFWYECTGKLRKVTCDTAAPSSSDNSSPDTDPNSQMKWMITKEGKMCQLPRYSRIHYAVYRGTAENGIQRSVDVTDIVKKLYLNNSWNNYEFRVNNSNMQGDPYPDQPKTLLVKYSIEKPSKFYQVMSNITREAIIKPVAAVGSLLKTPPKKTASAIKKSASAIKKSASKAGKNIKKVFKKKKKKKRRR